MSARPRPLKRLLSAALAAAALLTALGGDAAAQTPGAPTIDMVTARNGALEVEWTAPEDPGGSSIDAYDLRYIETSADETVDSNWTEVDDRTSGLRYRIEELDGEISYDVQVRAVNGEGTGDWSRTSTGVPLIGTPSIYSVLPAETTLTVSWNEPPFAGPGVVTSYDLRYIETSADETVDTNWTVKTSALTGGLLLYVVTGLISGTEYDVQVRAVSASVGDWSATASGTPQEHGETLETATTIAPGASRNGEIRPGTDVDYFKFQLARSTGILIFTRGGLDTVGELLDRNGTLIKANDDGYISSGIRNFLIWDSLPAGTYYVKVTSYGEATGPYLLQTRTIADSSSREDAHPILLGDLRNGLIDQPGETDWFTFTLAEQTDVVLRGTSRVNGELQDSSGQAISGVVSFDLPSVGFAYLATLAPGKYYIEVTPWSPLSTALYAVYVLEATEPGSTLSTALPLRFSRIAAGTIDPNDDSDYFRIQPDETAYVVLYARGDEVRVHGELLDSSGNPVTDAVLHPVFAGPVGFQLFDELAPGTHYIKVTGSSNLGIGPDTGPYAVLMFEDILYADFIRGCARIITSFSDPLLGCQWHLINSGQRKGANNEDINVEDVWDTTRGSGINVAVVDDGMHYEHRDLRDNVNTSLNHDYTGADQIFRPLNTHGTAVAGLIAASDNSIGVRGVAPMATIYGYNVLLEATEDNEADAMSRNSDTTAVSNNSWGPGDNPLANPAYELWERAVDAGVTDGYGGKGVFYVWAAGNGADDGDYGTLDEFANYYGVTAVCAVNDQGKRTGYSEMGANLWVCAPSGDRDQAAIATTTNFHRYTGGFGGTSAATPQVSGVAALVRSVDTSLSWRDVKLILAASARKNDPDNTGWETGALKYGSDTSDPEYYDFNHEYGFGVVDAERAVDLAGAWNKVPPMRKTGPVVSSRPVTVPSNGTRASSTISVDSDNDFTEFVQVDATFNAPDFRNLQVELVSPSGAVSVLSVPESDKCPYQRYITSVPVDCSLVGSFRFGSARHLGEDPSGTWTLRMADRLSDEPSNRLDSWSITVYGHKSSPDAPTLNFVEPDDESLLVSWAAPAETGTSAVIGYDVRHIPSSASASSKADERAWAVLADVGSVSTHIVTGLDNGVRRDVQVRAVNSSDAGDWSFTARGTPGAANSEPFFTEGPTASRTVLESATASESIGPPFAARDAESDTFVYSLGGRDAARFDIDSSSGQLRVKDLLDHETADSHRVTVSVHDGKADDDSPDTTADATIEVEVMVADVNEPPEVVGDPFYYYSENGQDEVAVFAVDDPEDAEIEWELLGDDEDAFNIFDGKIVFLLPPDYEAPTDHNDDGDYEITVRVVDGAHTVDSDVTISVFDVNEEIAVECGDPGNIAENSTRYVTQCDANDPEEGTIVWSLSGADGGDFEVVAGVLRFRLLPDYENESDFQVTVQGFDGRHHDSTSVAVTVTDVDELGAISLSSQQPEVDAALTADLDDPDGETGLSWQWERSDNRVVWTQIDGARSSSYTPVADDVGDRLRVTAAYSDRHGAKTVREAPTNSVRVATVNGRAPQFPVTENGLRTVSEFASLGQAVGARVRADDLDGDDLTYRLSGAGAAAFEVDESTGQLRTRVPLDFERQSVYRMTLTATDPSRAWDSITVTASVENEDEDATLTLSAQQPLLGTALTAALTDADGRLSGLDWAWESSSNGSTGFTVLDRATSPTYTPVEADLDQYLRVTVTYTDGHGPDKTEQAAAAHPVLHPVVKVTDPPSPRPTLPRPSLPSPPPPDPGRDDVVEVKEDSFSDLGDAGVHEEAVRELASAGVMDATGCGDGALCPHEAILRWEMAVWLVRVIDGADPPPTDVTRFEDVDDAGWWVAHVERLADLGITFGCSSEPARYCPDAPVNRAQMASFLVRAFELDPAPPVGFDDTAKSVHKANIDALFAAGITRGCMSDPLTYCTHRPTTRAQMASFLHRAITLPG